MTKANLFVATVKSQNDEIYRVVGTTARLIIESYEVFTLILGEGITSRNKNRDIDKRKNDIKEQKKQILKSNKIFRNKKIRGGVK